jgi:diguanylate cyclase (GGDEF)-like protein/PAS domain S-box-containing protein
MFSFSLKTKMSITVSLLVVVLMVASASLIISSFEKRFRETIATQQYTLVSEMARDIDKTIKDTSQLLAARAASFPPAAVADPDRAQRIIESESDLLTVFDNGVYLFSRTGRMIAEYPDRRRRGSDFSYREYFRTTMEAAKPAVSAPYFSSQAHHHPAVMFTAPVFDGDGKIVAVVAGSVDLTRDNFLGEHARVKIGKTGYISVFSSDRTIIMHPDVNRILKRDLPPGVNRLFDKAVAGFDGTEETVNSGIGTLTSVRHLKSVDWILAANFPLAEAYGPVREATRSSIFAVVVGVLLSVPIVWVVMKFLTTPLIALTRHMKGVSEHEGAGREFLVGTTDEIEDLSIAFNAMMRRLGRNQEELRNLSRAVEQSASLVAITNARGDIEYVNPKFCEVTGYAFHELMGQNPRVLKSEEMPAEVYRKLWGTITAGAEWQGEFHNKKRNGELFWTIASISPIKNERGEITHFIAVQEDITDRKETEAQLRHVSTHDMLTGLYNRAFFEEEMKRLARGRHFPVSIISADVDGLKSVNDHVGHDAGDKLLQAAARVLHAAFRAEDVVARIGGDEFAVLIPAAGEIAAAEAIERIRKYQDEANGLNGEFSLSISLGAATAESEEDLHRAMKLSDERMYAEKHAKKGMSKHERLTLPTLTGVLPQS